MKTLNSISLKELETFWHDFTLELRPILARVVAFILYRSPSRARRATLRYIVIRLRPPSRVHCSN